MVTTKSNTNTAKPGAATPEWTPEKFKAFAAEMDALHEETTLKLGKEDVDYIKQVKRTSRFSEILGRSLIHFSLDPLTWSAGVLALWLHHQLDTTEIGHAALHGCWDGLKGAEEFYSDSFRWNSPVEEKSWKREHNQLHHYYTNIVGRDPDLNYGSLRVADQTRWIPYHLIQITQFFWTAPLFLWVIGAYATGLTDLTHPPKSDTYANILPDKKLKTIFQAVAQSSKKMVPYFFYHFGFWPLLAGPFWWKVLAGNLTADMLRSIYTCATIYAGHFGDDLKYYDKSFKPKGRGEWYKSQIETAHDYDVPKLISLLCGALDFQIEHHLFPKLPPNRLREISTRVQEICERYGVHYQKAGWGKTLKRALLRIGKMSVPPQTLKALKSVVDFLEPVMPLKLLMKTR